MKTEKTLSSTHGTSQVVKYAIDAVLEKRMDKVKIARKNFSEREFTIFTQVYNLMIEAQKLTRIWGRLRIIDDEWRKIAEALNRNKEKIGQAQKELDGYNATPEQRKFMASPEYKAIILEFGNRHLRKLINYYTGGKK